MAAIVVTAEGALARSAGYAVVAEDGAVGEVETPLFPPDRNDPDYLVVRVRSRLLVRYPVVPAALVERVDAAGQVVYVRGRAQQIGALPEHLPLAT